MCHDPGWRVYHLFPQRGLTLLSFLFRASGSQQFTPTGKYKADGVLEVVRLSGKLSHTLWLWLGPPGQPRPQALTPGLGRSADWGCFGEGPWQEELVLWPEGLCFPPPSLHLGLDGMGHWASQSEHVVAVAWAAATPAGLQASLASSIGFLGVRRWGGRNRRGRVWTVWLKPDLKEMKEGIRMRDIAEFLKLREQ